MANQVPVRRHTRRRSGHTAEIARRLGYPEGLTVGGYKRRRAAVPRWKQTFWGVVISPTTKYVGRYKDYSLTIIEYPDGTFRWGVEKRGRFIDSGAADDAGTASRMAEAAAGYEYAKEVLDYGMAFQNPTERSE